MKVQVVLVLSLTLFIVVSAPSAVEADDSSFQEFLDSVGETLFFLAWPTAEYGSISFLGVTPVQNGFDVKAKLYGTSSLSGGPLWVELIVEIRNGEVSNIRWGRHNAIWAAPGETMKALGEALKEMTEEYQQSQGSSSLYSSPPPNASGQSFYFTNKCKHPIRIAVHYRTLGGQWKTEGWWHFSPGEGAYLLDQNRRLVSNNTIWYFYGETTDGSQWVWQGDLIKNFDGRRLGMIEEVDSQGDYEWSTICTQ